MRRTLTIAGLAALAVGVFAYREHHANRRHHEAKEFIESLVPHLHVYKQEHGRYPVAIPKEWYAGDTLPELLRRDFYLARAGGQEFLMRFRDPRVDPRFWWNDVVGFQSNIGHWAQWDGY